MEYGKTGLGMRIGLSRVELRLGSRGIDPNDLDANRL